MPNYTLTFDPVRDRYDPLFPAALSNPYPYYRTLQEQDPIHWGSADDAGLAGRWYVVRYDDVMAVLRDPRFGREVEKYVPPAMMPPRPPEDHLLAEVAEVWMILRDPPVHTRLRGLVMSLYTPRRVQQYAPLIEAAARRLTGEMRRAGDGCDLLTYFALPLSVFVTATMLGLPTTDLDQLTNWSRALAAVIDLNQADDIRQKSRSAVADCTAYVREVVTARRHAPQEDIVSALLADDASLSDEEIVGTVTHLLFVGNDPVMHMFGNAIITLDAHPIARRILQAQPDKIANGLEEIMRYDAPVQMTFRYALTDVELHGKQLHTGDHVAVVLGAANRDPAHYPAAHQLDLARTVGTPAHFGMGIHYCLGAPLARLEGQIGLATLFEEVPNLRPLQSADALPWQRTVAVRGVESLPVML